MYVKFSQRKPSSATSFTPLVFHSASFLIYDRWVGNPLLLFTWTILLYGNVERRSSIVIEFLFAIFKVKRNYLHGIVFSPFSLQKGDIIIIIFFFFLTRFGRGRRHAMGECDVACFTLLHYIIVSQSWFPSSNIQHFSSSFLFHCSISFTQPFHCRIPTSHEKRIMLEACRT